MRDTQFWCQFAPSPAYDHSVYHFGDWTLWHAGRFVVPHRVVYDDVENAYANTVLMAGQGVQRESRGLLVRQETPACSILTGWQGGNRYPEGRGPRYAQQNRSLAYLPGRVPVVVVFDLLRRAPVAPEAFHPKHQDMARQYPDVTGFLRASSPPTLQGRAATWAEGQAEWVLPIDSRLRVEEREIRWTPGAARLMDAVICVVSAGAPAAQVAWQDGVLLISRAQDGLVKLALDTEILPNLPEGAPDDQLYRRQGRAQAMEYLQ